MHEQNVPYERPPAIISNSSKVQNKPPLFRKKGSEGQSQIKTKIINFRGNVSPVKMFR